MVTGAITLRDQLHKYMYCGVEMSEMSFFTFMLDTYDAKAGQVDVMTGNHQGIDNLELRAYRRPPNR